MSCLEDGVPCGCVYIMLLHHTGCSWWYTSTHGSNLYLKTKVGNYSYITEAVTCYLTSEQSVGLGAFSIHRGYGNSLHIISVGIVYHVG